MQHGFGLTGLKTLLFVLVSLSSMAQPQTEPLAVAMDSIFKSYNRSNGPGCAVSIVRDGRLIFAKGYGIANLEYDIPITPTTVFDVASVSKQFAGVAISTLIEQGKLKLDDDIRTYIPEVPQFIKPITIRHLLHHTSGLRDWPEALNAAGWRWNEVFSFDDIMRLVKHQKDLDFDPGAQYSYSNTGYNLLALLVEKVSGKPFSQWTDEFIFTPLQMNDSHFQTDYTRLIKNLAYSYSAAGTEFAKSPGALTAYGSSSLFTTATDLSKWVVHFDRQISLKNPIYTRMLTEGQLTNGQTVPYGYGLGHSEDHGLTVISHTGAWAGYRTILTNYPDEKLSVILLSNFSGFNQHQHVQAVASVFLKTAFKRSKTTDDLNDAPTIDLIPTLVKKYAGIYKLGPGWAVTFSEENGQLLVQTNDEPKVATEAKSDSVLWIKAYGASMTFVTDKTGAVTGLRYKDILAKRITPWRPNPAEFPVFIGTYHSPELETDYKIDLVGGKLRMHHMRLGDFDLSIDPTQVDGFSCEIGTIQFIKKEPQKVTGLTLSSSRIRNIRFEKQ